MFFADSASGFDGAPKWGKTTFSLDSPNRPPGANTEWVYSYPQTWPGGRNVRLAKEAPTPKLKVTTATPNPACLLSPKVSSTLPIDTFGKSKLIP